MPLYLTDEAVDEEVKKRHIDRYTVAIAMVRFRGGKWLDAACGSGYGTWMMAEYADWVTGMDRDKDAITYAELNYGDEADATTWRRADEFIRRDILAPNLDPLFGNFDVIISVETIEHLNREGQMAWIRKVDQLLKPHGVFVLTCPIRPGGGPNPKNPKHLWEPDRLELLDMLSVYFGRCTHIAHEIEMTTGDIQPNLYVRAER